MSGHGTDRGEGARDPAVARAELIALMQLAYSGELAATHAYIGHARSVRDPAEKAEIGVIEKQEIEHRERVGEILAALGAGPDPRRERSQLRVGKVVGALCHVGGWLIPMYGAGWLERGNIVEYEIAARLAVEAGVPEFVDDLLEMAEVEWDHEQYFRGKVREHWMGRRLPIWSMPPPREAIREAFERGDPARR